MENSKKNLQSHEAVKKLQKLVEEIRICMFCTLPSQSNAETRPMATMKADDQGILWFFTHCTSPKIQDLQQDQDVQLIYAHPGKDSFLTVYGKASLMNDRDKIEELWNPMVKAWFPQGKDDPNICIIRVAPQEAYYWDNESNKMVEFLGIITAAITGKSKLAGSKEGELDVQSH
ncbi:MAG TPA: pyridoxamine 5'-phosphate oxidase family protein [Chitinophagaceae bacterium]|nr:pyridoxamine 5'-phosphate oxidase family protein [Chitinophagaceae bacterium]